MNQDNFFRKLPFESNLDGITQFDTKQPLLERGLAAARPDGFVAEFGVGTGVSINAIAQLLRETVYGFDSFEGLPEWWRPGFWKGCFKVDDPTRLQFANNVRIYKGLFAETVPIFLNEVQLPARFIHVDCDLYTSTRDVLFSLRERIVEGTIIQFDEFYGYPGFEQHEYRAFSEFIEQTNAEFEPLYWTTHEQVVVRILKA